MQFICFQDTEPSSSSYLCPPSLQKGEYQLCLLQFCSPSVKTCYGCRLPLKIKSGRDNRPHVPPPPEDLVIITAARREYWSKGQKKKGQLGNVYFHCRVACVRMKQQSFNPSSVVIPAGILERLQPVHQKHIAKELHQDRHF